jgi:predicted dithiol-disulfide oxidoreductase (DUF899 family)
MPTKAKKALPDIVSAAEWRKARAKLMVKEKKATRARDALAAERRRLPMVLIDKRYEFQGPDGKKYLLDLFEGRQQLLLYHFMFATGVRGWPKAGCPGCSMFADQVADLAHLHARDITFVMVSRAPLANLLAYEKRMGWTLPWFSSAGSAKGFRIKFAGTKRTVMDGPFTETKEVVAGYTIIQVKSSQEALDWAKRMPNPAGDGNEGEIEVRQMFELEDFGPSDAADRFRHLDLERKK